MEGSTLRNLATNLWVAERPLKLVVGDIGTRMTVIRLADNSLVLHSSVPLDAATRQALDELGAVRHVVAPSKVHHFFVGDYIAAYPQARIYGAPGLAAKRKDLRFDEVLSEEAPAAWRNEIEQHLFRGVPRMNEVVFFHRATRSLLLTDLAFNVAAERDIALTMDTPDRGLALVADDEKLRRVFDNLLKNAIEAIDHGPGQVGIEVSAPAPDAVCIGVRDTGPGIPENVQAFRLFETTKVNGSGLGLAVVKQIVLAHRGTIEFSRLQPHGTLFRIELPGSGPLPA